MRSATFGFRLCGIADEPFMPAANGSSTSRTSVRARCRISVAKRSSDEATIASVASSSAWRSRAITCVDTGSGSRPRRSQAIRSTSGSSDAYVPTVPENWPTRQPASARVSRSRSRSSSKAQPASFQPNVVGSAWMPCERPMQIVERCAARPRHDGGERTVDAGEQQLARVADLQRQRGVEDVRRREPVVHPAALRAELLLRRRRRTRRGRGRCCRSISATRSGVGGDGSRHAPTAASSTGTAPSSAQASSAASSTSSQRASLPSSDQIRLISGRE